MITKLTKIPVNYRQLKNHERLKKGDLYLYIHEFYKSTIIEKITYANCYDDTVGAWPKYIFFRRKHTAKNKLVKSSYGKCCVCLTPFKVGDEIKVIKTAHINKEFGMVFKLNDYFYCLKCYSIHIEKMIDNS